jgi:hypothetical protein
LSFIHAGGLRSLRLVLVARFRHGDGLFWRPKSRRSQPLAQVRASFGLASPAEGFIAYGSVGEQFGFFAEASGFFGKAFFKGKGLFETTSLRHDITSSYGS